MSYRDGLVDMLTVYLVGLETLAEEKTQDPEPSIIAEKLRNFLRDEFGVPYP